MAKMFDNDFIVKMLDNEFIVIKIVILVTGSPVSLTSCRKNIYRRTSGPVIYNGIKDSVRL